MANDNNMKFKLSVDVSDLKKGLEDAEKGFKKLKDTAEKLGDSTKGASALSNSIGDLGKQFNNSGGDLHQFLDSLGKYGKIASTVIKATELIVKALVKFGKEVIKTGKQAVKAFETIIKVSAKMGKAVGTALKGTAKAFASITKATAGFATALGGVASVAIGSFAKQASDLGESMNAVRVVFGDAGDDMVSWAKTAGSAFGISQQAVMDFSAQLGGYTKTLGLTTAEQTEMSKSLIALTGDVASLRNMTHSEVWDKFLSGLSGETEGIKSLGVDIKETAMSTFLLENGITKSWKSMSEAEKVMWRYKKIMNDLAYANGDFAKTLKSLPNQLRFLKMAFSDLSLSIGGIFLPVIEEALFGLTETFYDNIQEISKMIAGGDIKGALSVFGKVITEGITKVAKNLTPVFNNFGELVAGLLDGIAEGMEIGARNIEDGLNSIISSVLNSSDEIEKAGRNIADVLANILSSNMVSQMTRIGGEIILGLLTGIKDNFVRIEAFFLQELGNIIAEVAIFIPKFLTLGMDMAQSLMQGLVGDLGSGSFVDGVSDIISLMLRKINDTIEDYFPTLGITAMNLVGEIAQGISQNIPLLLPIAKNLITSFAHGIIGYAPDIIRAGFDILRGLVQGIQENLPMILTAAQTIIDSFITELQNSEGLIDGALSIIKNLVIFLGNNAPMIADAAIDILNQLSDGLNSDTELQNAASNIVQALARFTIEKKFFLFDSGLNLGWEFVKGLIQGLQEWLANFNFVDALLKFLLPDSLEGILNTKGGEIGTTFMDSVLKTFQNPLKGGVIWGDWWEGITGGAKETGTAKGTEIGSSYTTGVKTGIDSNRSSVFASGQGVGIAATKGAESELSNLSPATVKAMADATKALQQSATDMYNGAKVSFQRLTEVAKQEATNMYNGVKVSFEKLAQSGKQSFSDLYNGGANSIRSLSYAVQGNMNSIRSAINITNAVNSAISDFRRLASALSKPIRASVNISKTTTVSTVSARTQAMAMKGRGAYTSSNSSYREQDDRVFNFEIPLVVDGREMSRATAQFINGELKVMDNRKSRLMGGV